MDQILPIVPPEDLSANLRLPPRVLSIYLRDGLPSCLRWFDPWPGTGAPKEKGRAVLVVCKNGYQPGGLGDNQ